MNDAVDLEMSRPVSLDTDSADSVDCQHPRGSVVVSTSALHAIVLGSGVGMFGVITWDCVYVVTRMITPMSVPSH